MHGKRKYHQTTLSPHVKRSRLSKGKHASYGPHWHRFGRFLRKAAMVRQLQDFKWTKSKTKEITGAGPSDDIHSGKDRSKTVIWMSRRKLHGSQPVVYTQQNANYFGCLDGQQECWELSQDFTTPTLSDQTLSTKADPGHGQYTAALCNMNPNKTTTSLIYGVGLSGTGSANQVTYNAKINLHSISYEFQFSNQANMSGDIILYGCTMKKKFYDFGAIGEGTAETFNGLKASTGTQNFIGQWFSQWVASQNAGGVMGGSAAQPTDASGVQGAPTPGSTGPLIAGWSPFQYASFRRQFKCIFKKEINLAGGAVHKQEVRVHVNKTYKEQDLLAMKQASIYGLPGTTIFWFMIIRGSVVQVSDNGVAPQTNQNTSATLGKWAVAVSLIRKIKFSFGTVGTPVDEEIAAPTFRVPTGTSTDKVMNIVDAAAAVTYTS